MHGRTYPNLLSDNYFLFAHVPLSSSAYPMMTHPILVADNFPIKTLAKQSSTNNYMYSTCTIL